MNVFVFAGKKFTGPASWDELSRKQFLQYLNWRVILESDPAGRYVLLQLWYKIRYRHFRLLDDEQRLELTSLLDWLDERPVQWMLPRLRVGLRTYVGPGDGLESLTFGEFIFAMNARDRYASVRSIADLSELAASLYRTRPLPFQAKGEGQRSPFDRRTLGAQMIRMARLPHAVLLGVLMNFEGCLDRFPDAYQHLFAGGDGESGGTWLDVGISLARSTSALGTFEQLERTNLHLVLKALDAIMKEQKELKAQADKWNQK